MLLVDKKTTIEYIHHCIWVILLVCCALEFVCYPQKENVIGCASFVYGYFLVAKFVVTLNNIHRFPLATMAIFFY